MIRFHPSSVRYPGVCRPVVVFCATSSRGFTSILLPPPHQRVLCSYLFAGPRYSGGASVFSHWKTYIPLALLVVPPPVLRFCLSLFLWVKGEAHAFTIILKGPGRLLFPKLFFLRLTSRCDPATCGIAFPPPFPPSIFPSGRRLFFPRVLRFFFSQFHESLVPFPRFYQAPSLGCFWSSSSPHCAPWCAGFKGA